MTMIPPKANSVYSTDIVFPPVLTDSLDTRDVQRRIINQYV
jgi:hypothetical protein